MGPEGACNIVFKKEIAEAEDQEADIQIDNISVSLIHAKIIKGPN